MGTGAGREKRAAAVRAMLSSLGLFPTDDIEKDPEYDVWERNAQAEVHDLVERLSRADLWALRDLAWLLQS